MNEIKISIIVPIYNVKKYIERCLNSIIKQNFTKFEVILVDDGSTDGSGEVADNYADKFDFIKVVHKRNAGLGFARNTGLKYANGEYVLFIDSDDYIEPNMLIDLYSSVKKVNADVCYSDFFRDYGNIIVKNNHLKGLEGVYSSKDIYSKIVPWLIGGSPCDKFDDILGWGVWKSLYKNEIIQKFNLKFHSEREMISEDIIFQLDFLKKTNKAVIIDKPYYHYCLRKGSLSAHFSKDRLEKNAYLYHQELKRLKEMGILKQTKLRADRLLLAASRVNIMMAVSSQNCKDALKIINSYEVNKTYSSSLQEYPIGKLPFRQRVFAYFLKRKYSLLIYLISIIYVKKSNW